jgi:hypothetical protein
MREMMLKIRNIGIVVLGMLGVVGCTLTEKLDVEINMKPTLLLDFPSGDRVRTLHALAYTAEGVFVDSLRLDHPSLRGATKAAEGGEAVPDTLLAGVPEGEYRVVCYANLDQAKMAELVKGSSTLSQLEVVFATDKEYDCADELYHSVGTATVRRGRPARMQPGMKPGHYQVKLTLQRDEDDMTPVEDYSARLISVPDKVDGEGKAQMSAVAGGGGGEACCFTPDFATDEEAGRRTAEFFMSRFGDDHGVKLVLYKRGVEIARVPVLPSACGVDPANAEQVELPILIEIAIDKIMITILDWNTVIVQNAGVGG